MKQLIYTSQPFGFDRAVLAGILLAARRNNKRDDITGALICRRDVYLQLIEGPAPAINTLYSHILADDRHQGVRSLLTDTVVHRMFPQWEMLDDQAPSLFWSPAEVAGGAIEAASPADLLAIFTRLAASVGSRSTAA